MYLDESEGDFGLCDVENCICQTLKTGHLSLSVLEAVIGSQPCLQGTDCISAWCKTSLAVNAITNEVCLNVFVQALCMQILAGIQTKKFRTNILGHFKFSSELLMQLIVILKKVTVF